MAADKKTLQQIIHDLISLPEGTCPGTGTEVGFCPDALTALCSYCRQAVPVGSDEKRTWLRSHQLKKKKE